MIRAVLFDCDGVLVDSEPAHYEAFRRALRPEGIDLTSEAYLRRYLAFDDEELFRMVFAAEGRGLAGADLERLLHRKGGLLAESLGRLPVIEPSFRFARAALRAGLAVAVVSGARREEVRSVLARGGLLAEISVVVTTEDVRVGKPDPEPYLTALRRLNALGGLGGLGGTSDLEPADCLVVEDSIVGVRAGRAAGMRVVALTTSYPAEALDEADLVLPGLEGMTAASIEELL